MAYTNEQAREEQARRDEEQHREYIEAHEGSKKKELQDQKELLEGDENPFALLNVVLTDEQGNEKTLEQVKKEVKTAIVETLSKGHPDRKPTPKEEDTAKKISVIKKYLREGPILEKLYEKWKPPVAAASPQPKVSISHSEFHPFSVPPEWNTWTMRQQDEYVDWLNRDDERKRKKAGRLARKEKRLQQRVLDRNGPVETESPLFSAEAGTNNIFFHLVLYLREPTRAFDPKKPSLKSDDIDNYSIEQVIKLALKRGLTVQGGRDEAEAKEIVSQVRWSEENVGYALVKLMLHRADVTRTRVSRYDFYSEAPKYFALETKYDDVVTEDISIMELKTTPAPEALKESVEIWKLYAELAKRFQQQQVKFNHENQQDKANFFWHKWKLVLETYQSKVANLDQLKASFLALSKDWEDFVRLNRYAETLMQFSQGTDWSNNVIICQCRKMIAEAVIHMFEQYFAGTPPEACMQGLTDAKTNGTKDLEAGRVSVPFLGKLAGKDSPFQQVKCHLESIQPQ